MNAKVAAEIVPEFYFLDGITGEVHKATERIRGEFKLRGKPKQSCKKCYGRGYAVKDAKTKSCLPCSCCIDR